MYMYIWIDRWMDEWIDWWMNGWMDGWASGWMNYTLIFQGATIPAMSYLLGRWCPPDERCLLQSIANTGNQMRGSIFTRSSRTIPLLFRHKPPLTKSRILLSNTRKHFTGYDDLTSLQTLIFHWRLYDFLSPCTSIKTIYKMKTIYIKWLTSELC